MTPLLLTFSGERMIAGKPVALVLVFSFWFLCAFSSLTYAQTPTGTIAGVLTDPAGAHVGGARVIIIKRDSGLRRSLTTSTEGDFAGVALPAGTYQLTAEATGFHRMERTTVVEAGTTTTVNLSLQIGDVTEQVTVDYAAPLINYE